ncbi:hypothetical protein GCM10007385_07670 [Tateyamaria omphalii]|uniref:S8 family serine peptidase n=1 Tax=Tateyamaria omphalii TaxID=299262 RepID=UPI001671D29E|nr:S8 family serine peptidase [Tateyamaria omphalii]GGX42466.1 hypothetical protein GCM10007385_07670 [Tateyamaria omphalii]
MTPAAAHVECADGPYEAWVYGTGKGYKHPGLDRASDALTCVFEASEPVEMSDIPSRWSTDTGEVLIPALWTARGFKSRFAPALFYQNEDAREGTTAARLQGFQACVGQTAISTLTSLAPGPRIFSHVNYPVREQTVFRDWADSAEPDPATDPESIVIVAIVDDGIPFCHRNFVDAAGQGTRIDYCWSQSATQAGHPMLFGREYDKATIDALYHQCAGDEGAIYRAAGLAGGGDPDVRNPLDQAFSHGAHVLDSLAGQTPGNGDSKQDRVHIIAVDLPAMASAETSGFGKDMFVLSAMHYIFDRAERIAAAHAKPGARVPLIVNLSYGHSSGPHDGNGVIEAAFDEMIAARRAHHPTAVILPSGNMFMQSIHAVMTEEHFAEADGVATLDWFLPPDDRTSSFLEIWFPDGLTPDDLRVELVPPAHGRLDAGDYGFPSADTVAHSPITKGAQPVGQLSTQHYRDGRWRHVIALAPTDVLSDQVPAPAGRWTVRVTKTMAGPVPGYTEDPDGQSVAGGLQLWVQRDEDFGGARTGARQSYFIDPRNALYADDGRLAETDSQSAMVRRFGTMSGMATGQHVLRVGGYDESTLRAARYSCAGALRTKGDDMLPAGAQVQLSAASERSFTQPGIVSAGTRSGTYIAQSGTSSAAPQVARALADAFLDTPDGEMKTVADYLEKLDLKTGTGDPKGPDRLGLFVLRDPRMSGADDERARIAQLVQARSEPHQAEV